MTPVLLLRPGAFLTCPDCGTLMGRLLDLDPWSATWGLPADVATHGVPLWCPDCGFLGQATLDVAEDPAMTVWRISRHEQDD